ncbi:hypothetical protein LA10_05974 [Thermotoga neapolitana LA10]|nr:hypothetical protein LA10_05974 [Thermotoga neapolitana LA10]
MTLAEIIPSPTMTLNSRKVFVLFSRSEITISCARLLANDPARLKPRKPNPNLASNDSTTAAETAPERPVKKEGERNRPLKSEPMILLTEETIRRPEAPLPMPPEEPRSSKIPTFQRVLETVGSSPPCT